MAKSKSSRRWLQEHEKDQYVQRSRKDGYRSRASYKLLELDDKSVLFNPGQVVVDLGAAPGGWSQVAAARVGDKGTVIASDILAMDTIADVQFVQGDFKEPAVFDAIVSCLGGKGADLVISDMAPNMSGMKAVDQPRAMYLVELAFDFATQVLRPGGVFVTKVFHGEGFDQLLKSVRGRFDKVSAKKPGASRSRSREVYWVAKGYRGEATPPG
ncbi:MAG: 23S rRNA (uridine(2552)-2'-O)-methyltransferase RlmE [Gammaproteobacteria bacterium]|nr:MAG: 23S rRNA (uridine(2552)-2'-O)-methyltransferase RlmE [Gammaproteobacteria bacterium]RLA50477.1 MAG: 23S rRNA (uridine(2552)-2'-O)-methyltransferase RlmE [Gammaproteobacteria bacterium]